MGQPKATEAGVPQGGYQFPDIDEYGFGRAGRPIADNLSTKGSTSARKHEVNMVRYAEDFVIIDNSREVLAERVKPMVEKFLAEPGRRGMEWWTMIVLAMLKEGLNCDFDRLQHLANHDGMIA